MSRHNRPFIFKQFAVYHHRSSLKVGVDGVMAGAWCDFPDKGKILDVGTGCGLIALMAAQRTTYSKVLAIDIDHDSVDEAKENFLNSDWNDRLCAYLFSFDDILNLGYKFDYIVSNPPFFSSGIDSPDTPRLTARHTGTLSPLSLVSSAKTILNPNGKTGLIAPYSSRAEIIETAYRNDLFLFREAFIKGHAEAPVKRVLLEFGNTPCGSPSLKETIILETSPGCPTDTYRLMCKDFYLKF